MSLSSALYTLAALIVVFWILQLLLIYLEVSAFADFWKRWNHILPAPDPITYIALGDSTAQGVGTRHVNKSYPFLLKLWLETHTSRHIRLINLSKSGAKVRDCVEHQLPKLVGLKIQVLTVAVGANDMKSYDKDRFKRDFTELLDALPPGSYVADIPSFTGRARKLEPMVLSANKTITALCKSRKVKLVHLHAKTKKLRSIRYFSADYFHPNARAYKHWAEAFRAEILQQTFKKR